MVINYQDGVAVEVQTNGLTFHVEMKTDDQGRRRLIFPDYVGISIKKPKGRKRKVDKRRDKRIESGSGE